MPLMSILRSVSDNWQPSHIQSASPQHPSSSGAYDTVFNKYAGSQWTPRALADANSVDETAILARSQRHIVQVIATVGTSFSILASLTAVYWFCMMRRNFRRDLILLLFVGDFFKSFWIMCFACYTFVNGPVPSASRFCQANGYLLQVSLELCDFAILAISLHMYLQIFPWTPIGRDGLYNVRHWTYALWFIIPNITAALAFVNDGLGYQAAGAFCTLPVRPIWYRLALSWIPRYLIWLFFMAVAIRIYFFVGREFKVFRDSQPEQGSTDFTSSSDRVPAPPSAVTTVPSPVRDTFDRDHITFNDRIDYANSPFQFPGHLNVTSTPGAHSTSPAHRRASTPDWSQALGLPMARPRDSIPMTRSLPSSRRGSRQIGVDMVVENAAGPVLAPTQAPAPAPLPASVPTSVPSSVPASAPSTAQPQPPMIPINSQSHIASFNTSRSSGSYLAADAAHLPTIAEIKSAEKGKNDTANDAAARIITDRRRAMQRQLRMLFIYPVVYIIMWFFPFVNHCLNYSDRYAQNPIFAINILNILCQATMGFVDVCVFSSREKPWKHIPGSDGTFFGSFKFYTFGHLPAWLSRVLPDHDCRPRPSVEGTSSQSGSSHEKDHRLHSLVTLGKRQSTSPSVGSNSVQARSEKRARDSSRRPAGAATMQQQLASEHAQTRLTLERADWQNKQRGQDEQHRSSSLNGQVPPSPRPPPSVRRDWWDTDTNHDLFRDDEPDIRTKSYKKWSR